MTEDSSSLNDKMNSFKDALEDLKLSLKIDLSQIRDSITLETLKCGQIQKFEFTIEIAWKIISKFLYEFHGIESRSPLQSVKEFYLNGLVTKEEYEVLVQMIKDRNLLSHVYKENIFLTIYDKLKLYETSLQKIYELLDKKINHV